MGDKNRAERVLAVVLAALSYTIFVWVLTIPFKIDGFYIGPGPGGRCVYADAPLAADPRLFCSDDIYAVMEAESRYRKMPLGILQRHKER